MSFSSPYYTTPILTRTSLGPFSTTTHHLRKYEDGRLPKDFGKDAKCETNVTLFIPGHLGNYWQSRSLGSHGLNLHERRITPNPDFSTEPTVNVYTLDFMSFSLSALHGAHIERQAATVRDAVEHLSMLSCEGSVTLVGHSIGGVVALAAAEEMMARRTRKGRVEQIILLAAPVESPVIRLDKSVELIYGRIRGMLDITDEGVGDAFTRPPKVIAIGGGHRDAVVRHHLTNPAMLGGDVAHVDATDIIGSGGDICGCGVDHRAIVWCQQVIAGVIRVIRRGAGGDEARRIMLEGGAGGRTEKEEEVRTPKRPEIESRVPRGCMSRVEEEVLSAGGYLGLEAVAVLWLPVSLIVDLFEDQARVYKGRAKAAGASAR